MKYYLLLIATILVVGCGENWQGPYRYDLILRTNGHAENPDRFLYIIKPQHVTLICDDARGAEYRAICSNGGHRYE